MSTEPRATNRSAVQFHEIQVSVYPSQKTYLIKNISKGGLAIEYNPVADEPFESETIDIIAVEYDRFYLPRIACKKVYHIGTLGEGRLLSG